MELSKEVAFLAELLISLDGGEEVRMLVFEGAPTAIEKGSGEAQIVGKTEGGRDLEGVEIVVIRGGGGIRTDVLVIVVGAEGELPRARLPIDGVPACDLHFVGAREMGVPIALNAGVIGEVLLLVGIAQDALMGEVGAIAVGIVFEVGGGSCFVDEEIADFRIEESAGDECLQEVVPCLVAHAGQIAMVIALMCPEAVVFGVVLAIPVVHHAVTVAKGEHPRAVGVVELYVEVADGMLSAILPDIPGVFVVHLCTKHQPEVTSEERRVELNEAVRIGITDMRAVAGGSGVVGTYLGKEYGIVVEGVGVGEHETDEAGVREGRGEG